MIIGEKVILTKPNKEDMSTLHEWRNNPIFRQYYREFRETNLDDQMDWYENVLLKDTTWHHFTVSPKDNDKIIIGVVFLNHIHAHYRTGEFGITLADDTYRGKGYGKDMLITLIKYGFNELNLNRIWCEVYSNNNSIHLYKKLGFKSEGTLRENVYKNGNYLDSHILGMLKKEFFEIYGEK